MHAIFFSCIAVLEASLAHIVSQFWVMVMRVWNTVAHAYAFPVLL